MALTDENSGIGATMLVGPTGYGGYPMMRGYGGGMGFGGDWAWILLLLLIGGNGWGNGFGGGFGGGLGIDFPWLMNGQNSINNNVNDGFRDAQLHDSVTSVRDGVSNLATQLCGCCGDMQMALANGFSGVEQGANARAMANMQQLFGLQSQFADCCCENRLANCQTQNIIQNEGNATRFADANNTRDLLTNQTANTQAILDKLCQLELDAKNDKINDLERQLTMANLQASQTAQNAFIQQGFTDEVDQLYNRLSSCPVPSMPVYGRTPIFTCPSQNNGCGCGCNGGF